MENAKQQYCQDRDSRETIFELKRRTLVHFALDTELACNNLSVFGHFPSSLEGKIGQFYVECKVGQAVYFLLQVAVGQV